MSSPHYTAVAPTTSIMPNKDGKTKQGTSHDTSLKPGLLAIPSAGTYGNGLDVMGAAFGSADNKTENVVRQIEIPSIHPQSNTPYDKTTAFAAGDPLTFVEHEEGKEYWLPASSLSASAGDTLITAANGLVALADTNDITVDSMVHTWRTVATVSSASWVRGIYMGKRGYYTAAS